jgi:hypothetical protein
MGYNRGGKNRTERLKRRKREENRLMKKATGQATKAPEPAQPVKETQPSS